MPFRLRHALRFAVTTLVTVYILGVAWELVDAYLIGDIPAGMGAAGTVALNEGQWRLIAPIEAVVVLLLRLGDLRAVMPSWRFAWTVASLLALATVTASEAIDQRAWWVLVVVVVVALCAWIALNRRRTGVRITTLAPAERELH